VNRSDAQKIIDDLTDENIKSIIIGLFTELRDKSGDQDSVMKNYQQRIINQNNAHALVTSFINRNFDPVVSGKKTRRNKNVEH
jgi:hypothetical protein